MLELLISVLFMDVLFNANNMNNAIAFSMIDLMSQTFIKHINNVNY